MREHKPTKSQTPDAQTGHAMRRSRVGSLVKLWFQPRQCKVCEWATKDTSQECVETNLKARMTPASSETNVCTSRGIQASH